MALGLALVEIESILLGLLNLVQLVLLAWLRVEQRRVKQELADGLHRHKDC